MPNKKLHADTYCYARFCVCRCAPFYTKALSAVCAGELGVRRKKRAYGMDIKTIYELLANSTETPGIVHEIASSRIDAESGVADGDPEDVDNFLCSVTDLALNASDAIVDWLSRKSTSSKTIIELDDLLDIFQESREVVEITSQELISASDEIAGLVQKASGFISSHKDYLPEPEAKYYVYTHADPTSRKVFYVGKGTGNRAWGKEREQEWHAHIASIDGKYVVEIVRDHLTESEALELEDDLILQMTDHLVNKKKPFGLSF